MRVIIAGVAEGLRERFRQIVLGNGLQCQASDCVTHQALAFRVLEGPADLIVFGLGLTPAATLPLLRQIAGQTKAPIIAIGSTADADVILQALRGGASEYLRESDFGEGLLPILGKMRQAGVAAIQWGEILAVVAAKPGIGATTVACNMAFALASHYPQRVSLAELGGQVPELALNLNVRPMHSLADLAIREDRLDPTLLRQLLVEHAAQLNLLIHQPDTLQATLLAPPVMRTILVLLRTMFDYTVIDLGHLGQPTGLAALEMASKVVVVVGLDVPALRLSRRFLRELVEVGVAPAKLVVVANRYGQRRQFPWKQAQEALGQPIHQWIPDDVGLVNQALNLGQPLVTLSRRATITRRFDELASHVNGKDRGIAIGVAG